MKIPKQIALAAYLRFASGNTILAPFPPSSKVTGVRLSLALAITVLPVGTPPVRTIPSTPLCPASASPINPPDPVITCKTPDGRPTSASSIFFIHAISDNGVHDAGLAITVHPAARAGAIDLSAS